MRSVAHRQCRQGLTVSLARELIADLGFQPSGLTDMDYTKVHLPETEAILDTCIQIALNETTTSAWVQEAAQAIRKIARYYAQ